jgi:tRNA 2-thiocytidine biosynthesis protein TtcA
MSELFTTLSASKRRTVMLREMKRTIAKFGLLESGDHVIIAVSGGIDSLTMLDLLADKSPWWAREVRFTPVHIVAGFPQQEEKLENLAEFSRERGMELIVVHHPEIATIAMSGERPQNPCFVCSRLRRKAILETAEKIDANKIAFGHHREDVLQTFLINIFWGREISTMMPIQPLFGGRFRIIRPMFMINESKVRNYALSHEIIELSAQCPMEGKTKRDYVSDLLNKLEKDHKGTKSNLFRSLFHVKPDYLLGNYTFGKNPFENSGED